MKKKLLFAVLIILLSLSGFYLFRKSKQEVLLPSTNNYQEKIFLQKILKEKGPQKTYDYFKEFYKDKEPSKPHELLHWLGGEIYNLEGIKGASICDESFNWGCFHGFFGRAISLEGEKFIKKAEAVCSLSARDIFHVSDCFHGMGHGILAWEGYDTQNLLKSLDYCSNLEASETRQSCANGVFMEYNFGTMHSLNTDKTLIRQFKPENPLEPCDKIPEFYKSTCFSTQIYWWRDVLKEDFAKISGICNKLEVLEKRSCFSSLGVIFLSKYENNIVKTGESCTKYPDKDGSTYCVEGAIQYLLAKNKEVKNSLDLCSYLSPEGKTKCLIESNNFSCKKLNHCDENN